MQRTSTGSRPALTAVMAILAGVLVQVRPVAAQEGVVTSGVFQRYADQVIKIEVVETGSAAKVGVGTGFFVDAAGNIVTNYHVIADYIHEPDRHRIELVEAGGTTTPLTILAVDVVNDLAILASEKRPARYFTLTPIDVAQGARLYSLGHPQDLGLSIVEGTFNGYLRHTLYPKIHFTGSINPGMSGGPTISDDGRVVGINVMTSGDQVSFLVPVERAIALVDRATAPDYTPPDSILAEIGEQIIAYQAEYLDGMFEENAKMVELGPYRAVTEPAPFFRCWGDASRDREQPYEQVSHWCGTDDVLYIANDQSSSTIEVSHDLLTTTSLNATRFHALYTAVFSTDNTPYGAEEHVTRWRCETRTVRNETTPLRAMLCLRRYRKFDALLDAVLKVAVLGQNDSGLVSTLTMAGVTQESIDTLTRRYMERITWR